MVGAASGIQFMQSALLYQALGAYVAVLSEEKGWSKTALSGGSAVHAMEAALLGPVLGWVIDKFGAQLMIKLGVLALGIGLMLLGQIESVAGFYGAILVIALGSSLCGFFPLNVSIIHWFDKMRARALSGVALGLAFGGIAMPLVAWSMQVYGWRATAVGSGALMIIVGMPLAMVFRGKPEDHGEVPDGHAANTDTQADVTTKASNQPTPVRDRDFSAREAIRTRAFWLLALGHGMALLVVTGVNVHAINHMKKSLDFSLTDASIIIMAMTVSQIAGVMIGWVIGDRFTKRYVAAACMFGHCFGMLLLTYASGWTMLYLFAICHGVAWGLRGPFMQAIRADYFGRSSIGKIMGFSSMVVVLGQIGGPMIAGYLGDVTGDYNLGFTVLAALAGCGSVMFLMAQKPTAPAPSRIAKKKPMRA
ncbi:MAG: MFS transporter [Burkholderiaceae bacterium]